MRALLLCLLLLGVTGCPPANPNYPFQNEPDPRAKELTLGVGDVVEIEVYEQKDLKAEVPVRADGFVTMPLVGDLKALGETPSALRMAIKTKLADFVKLQGQGTTEITVSVKAWKSYRFTVQGEAVRNGVFQSDQFVQVSDAIAMAGGLTRFAKRDDIKIFRTDAKTREVRQIPISYDILISGKRPEMDVWILPGDTISVP